MRLIAMLVGIVVRVGAPLGDDESAGTLPPMCELRAPPRSGTSLGCMSCHDGSVAAHVGGLDERGSGRHPVDVDYEAVALQHPESYRAPGALPSSVVLTQGMLTCATCHSARSSEPGHTALPMERSRLCLACHLY
jgi:predicted CXXCH cytochrome family protein